MLVDVFYVCLSFDYPSAGCHHVYAELRERQRGTDQTTVDMTRIPSDCATGISEERSARDQFRRAMTHRLT